MCAAEFGVRGGQGGYQSVLRDLGWLAQRKLQQPRENSPFFRRDPGGGAPRKSLPTAPGPGAVPEKILAFYDPQNAILPAVFMHSHGCTANTSTAALESRTGQQLEPNMTSYGHTLKYIRIMRR